MVKNGYIGSFHLLIFHLVSGSWWLLTEEGGRMERGVAVPCLPTMLRSEASLPLPDRPPPTRPSHDRIAEGTAVHQYISPPFCAGGVASLWLYRMPTPRIVGYRCWRIPSFRGKKNKEVGRRTGLFDVGALAGSRL